MTRRTLWLSGVALLVVTIAATAVVLWRRGRVDPLPPPVRVAVTNEKSDRARIDSQLVAATLEAQAAQQRQEAANARAQESERRARIIATRADSLAREAERAANAQDSARYYHGAYDARTAERDTLLYTIAEKNTALMEADVRIASLAKDTTIANRARHRADSVLDAVVQSVTACTVPGTFGRIRCPSRKTALAVGILGGLAIEEIGRAVKDGRLRIPLPVR